VRPFCGPFPIGRAGCQIAGLAATIFPRV